MAAAGHRPATTTALLVRDRLFIGGDWVAPAGDGTITVVSPSTEQPVGGVPDATPADIDRAVASARAAFDEGPWPQMAVEERRAVLRAGLDRLRVRAGDLDWLTTTQMGAPMHPVGQGTVAVSLFDYFLGVDLPLSETRRGDASFGVVCHEPVGVAGIIVPWNAPSIEVVMKVVPALLVGCTVVLKPAPETPLDPYLFAEALHDAGLPPGALNVVAADREVGEELVRDPRVDRIGFTGSTAAGKRIAGICAEQVKRVGLELGGKSAVVVLDDVDADQVVPTILAGGMLVNSGQACSAWTRILVPRSRHEELVDALCDAVADVAVGDPFDPATRVGPLASARQRDRVEGYVAVGRAEGATVAMGGGRPTDLPVGWYVEPTVFVDVDNRMRIAQEEIFGPVVAVIDYDGDDDAVRIANDSVYGLHGGVLGADADRAHAIARRLRAGTVGVNCLGGDFSCPLGGFKQSGFGRELGPEGFYEYTEIKTYAFPNAG